LGEGWWIASDGKWYPAESHPDASKRSSSPDPSVSPLGMPVANGGTPLATGSMPLAGTQLTDTSPASAPDAGTAPTPDASTQPAPGWWQAADGNWYAPELHPAAVENIELVRPGRSAVTRAAGASAPGGVHALPARFADGPNGSTPAKQAGSPPAPDDLDFDPMLDFDTLFGGLDDPVAARPSGPSPEKMPQVAPRPASPTAATPSPTSSPPAWLPAAIANTPRPSGLRMPDHGSYNAAGGASDNRAAAEAAPGTNALDRPVSPGFGKLNAPPSGSTVHEELPGSQMRPQSPSGERPLSDGFDELLQSVLPASRPPHAQPPQRLTGASGEPHGAWTTSGGPASATPPMSPQQADFFVMKPSHRKHKAAQTKPRTKLSALIFLIALLIVLAAVVVTVLYIHH
jgi:hypothetical protein